MHTDYTATEETKDHKYLKVIKIFSVFISR